VNLAHAGIRINIKEKKKINKKEKEKKDKKK